MDYIFINTDYPGEKGEHLLKKKKLRNWGAPLIKKLILFAVINYLFANENATRQWPSG